MKKVSFLKRRFLQALALSPLAASLGIGAESRPGVTRIAFGSCLHQDKPQPVWDAVLKEVPDIFVFLGDNIYGDSDDPAVLKEKYQKLAMNPGFQQLKASTALIATWDDHDYGRNDAGLEYEVKQESRALMLDFWEEPADSPRRQQNDGIYTVHWLEQDGRKVQIILLDLRWNRTPLNAVASAEEWAALDAKNMGPYSPTDDPDAVLVGEGQWQWLEQQLRQEADIRIIGSSIQCLADFTGWETWANFPAEKARLYALLQDYQEAPVLMISGDVHWCELSREDVPGMERPLLELTSSGLTETWEKISPNQHRVGDAHAQQNFGLIDIEWQEQGASIALWVKNPQGEELVSYQYQM